MIHDELFCEVPAPRFPTLLDEMLGEDSSLYPQTQAGRLAITLPKFRNHYFHGVNLLSPDFLYLTLHVREAADALTMPRTPEWKKEAEAIEVRRS